MNPPVSLKELGKFGLTMGVVLIVVFGGLLPWLLDRAWPTWPWVVGFGLVAVGSVVPGVLRPVRDGWLRFAHVLGRINSTILLSLVYYLAITPMAVILRLFKRDLLALRTDPTASSYRVERDDRLGREDMQRPF